MELLNLVQGTDEWLCARLEHLTASEAPVMMGDSKFMSRDQLLDLKKGWQAEPNSKFKERLFEKGHLHEDLARQVLEFDLCDEVLPVVGRRAVEGLELLASFDGYIADRLIWEHKDWNKTLAQNVANHLLEPEYYWQLEHQMLVSGFTGVLFTVSDGTVEQRKTMNYKSQPERRAALIAGWKQFVIDLDKHQLEAKKEVVVGRSVSDLPALTVQIAGEVKTSNLAVYKSTALQFIQSINTDLQTDQDFADAEKTVKFCTNAEKELETVKKQALAQTADIDELFRTVDHLKEEMRNKRLELNKLVKARKEAIKVEIIAEAQNKLIEHQNQINLRLPHNIVIHATAADFHGAIKGKRNIASMRSAINDTLAAAKIEITGIREVVETNLTTLEDLAAEHKFLFNDLQQIAFKESGDFKLLVKSRIGEHKAAEEKRLEAERERIRQEEERKAQAEAERKAEAERQRIAQEERARIQEEQRKEREAQAEMQKLQQQADADFSQRMDEEFSVPHARPADPLRSDVQITVAEPEPEGQSDIATVVSVHVKVCDRGHYEFKNSSGETLVSLDEAYVPGFFPDDHYGDYLILDIELATGRILNWKAPSVDEVQASMKPDSD